MLYTVMYIVDSSGVIGFVWTC